MKLSFSESDIDDISMQSADFKNGISNKASVTIHNLLSNKYLANNENNKPYATSVTIEIPAGQEMTPIDVEGITISSFSGSILSDHFFDFDDDDWQSISSTRIFKGSKRLNNGELQNATIGEIDIPAGQSICLFKLSADNANEYELSTICNSGNEDATIAIEIPEFGDLRGWKNWLKRIYKGAMYIVNLASYLSPVPGTVGTIASTITTVGNSVNAVAGPYIDLLDEPNLLTQTRSDRRKFIYERNINFKSNVNETNIYHLTDDKFGSINSEFFEPISQKYENDNDTRMIE